MKHSQPKPDKIASSLALVAPIESQSIVTCGEFLCVQSRRFYFWYRPLSIYVGTQFDFLCHFASVYVTWDLALVRSNTWLLLLIQFTPITEKREPSTSWRIHTPEFLRSGVLNLNRKKPLQYRISLSNCEYFFFLKTIPNLYVWSEMRRRKKNKVIETNFCRK